jgi:hypothetical protein
MRGEGYGRQATGDGQSRGDAEGSAASILAVARSLLPVAIFSATVARSLLPVAFLAACSPSPVAIFSARASQ